METEIVFTSTEEETAGMARALGLSAREHPIGCPFMIGDSVSFPEMPKLAFVVVWRHYSHGSATKPSRWLVGVEQTHHPLEDPPAHALV